MGFDGFVVGDWNSHASVAGCTKFSCAAALNAGLDVYMAPDSWRELYKNTLMQVRSGEISVTRVDDAVRRVLRVKLRAHLLDEGRPSSRPLAGRFDLLGAPAHRAVARQAVQESLVLLKNAHHLLPLSPHAHVLVAGDGADDIGKQSGGWTITWQGTGVSNKDFPHGESIYAGIRAAVTAAGGTAELNVAGEFKSKPDVAIVVFGENPYAEFQGDIATAEYSPGAKPDLALLRKLHASRIPVVAVFLSGRPLWVNPEINASDAFIAAWLPGTEGGGIADVLFKAANGSVPHDFHGKLSFSWPRTPQQTATALDRPDDPPLFPYGYGLRYHDNGDLKKLPEDPGTARAAPGDTHVFFAAGRAGPGWAWVAGAGVTLSAADKSAQEDARLLSWKGPLASVGLSGSTPIDLQREANGQLSLAFDYRAGAPISTNIALEIACGPNCHGSVPIAHALSANTPGQWGHLKVPLACFANAGADMSRVTTPFALQATGPLTLSVANIRLESGLDGAVSCQN
jgi:beta-glucosidase